MKWGEPFNLLHVDKDCIFPWGYGQRFGEALLSNTQMNKLLFRLSDLVSAKQMDYSYTPNPALDDSDLGRGLGYIKQKLCHYA
jgi:hypothetical protein